MKAHRDFNALQSISRALGQEVDALSFAAPVAFVYNPLSYAWPLYAQYVERYARVGVEALFLGMNPGPWGMAQTGVPFGEVSIVRDWLALDESISRPAQEHPKRPILGLACQRSEVSGARLWGWARERFKDPAVFFRRFFVANYCPLAFMEDSGRNRTPDKLPAHERTPLYAACDRALVKTVQILRPKLVIGVGKFAEDQARRVLADCDVEFGRVLHPSPASPIANRGWAPQAEKDLRGLGITLP